MDYSCESPCEVLSEQKQFTHPVFIRVPLLLLSTAVLSEDQRKLYQTVSSIITVTPDSLEDFTEQKCQPVSLSDQVSSLAEFEVPFRFVF